MNETIIRFGIFSQEIQYQDIGMKLGLEHDSFCMKGGRMNNAERGVINESHVWIKNSGLSREEWDEDLHFEEILKFFKPLKKELLELKKDGCNFQLDIIIYTHKVNPGVYIEEKYNSFFSEIGVNINVDIYCLGEDEEE